MTSCNLKRDEIRKLAKINGLAKSYNYTIKELCMFLNIKFIPGRRNMTTPYFVRNVDTNVEIEYPSGYKAMKALGMSCEFYQHAKTQKPITINGVKYIIRKHV